ncbi:MAG TPA: chromosome partitioning protein ParB, partial [Nocardioidaceae bacterium]|nr:chromosome partitioning protein ParB [Nocardioidaceae bacterium]
MSERTQPRRGLGRGLGSLIPTGSPSGPPPGAPGAGQGAHDAPVTSNPNGTAAAPGDEASGAA